MPEYRVYLSKHVDVIVQADDPRQAKNAAVHEAEVERLWGYDTDAEVDDWEEVNEEDNLES